MQNTVLHLYPFLIVNLVIEVFYLQSYAIIENKK